MKVIHWSPVKNKSAILKEGILIKDTWTSGSVLTPFKNLNRWWLDLLLNDQEYLGFVFELEASDFPLVHDHWIIDTYTEEDDDFEVIYKRKYTLKEILKNNPHCVFSNEELLKDAYRRNIVWRIGCAIDDEFFEKDDEEILKAGINFIKNNKKKAFKNFFDDPDFMEFVFEDFQVLFFKDIAPDRIEKVIKANTNYQYHDLLDEIKSSFR
jgi:hypothetical protein